MGAGVSQALGGAPLKSCRRGFSLIELLIAMGLLLILMTGLGAVMAPPSPVVTAHRDMDRLARWLDWAMVRSGRWRNDFYMTVAAPFGQSSGHFIEIQWLNSRENVPLEREFFHASPAVRWRVQGTSSGYFYSGDRHSLTPALTLQSLTSQGQIMGEELILSARGLVTRRCLCGN